MCYLRPCRGREEKRGRRKRKKQSRASGEMRRRRDSQGRGQVEMWVRQQAGADDQESTVKSRPPDSQLV